MTSQTVDKILLSEKQAATKETLAHIKSEQILSDATAKAQEIIAKATCDGKAAADCLMQENRKQTNEIMESTDKDSRLETEKIKDTAQDRKEKAIDIVIGKILSK